MKLKALLAVTLTLGCTFAQDLRIHGTEGDFSLKLEIQRSIDRGLAYLAKQQNAETGSFGDEIYPALTALPVSAFMGNLDRDPVAELPENISKAYEFILSNQKRNGAIYGKGLATYNTSLSLMALLHISNREGVEDAIRQARRFLINQQADEDIRGETDSPFDGGIGYGGSHPHSDMSNSHLAMEALFYSRQVLADRPGGVGMKLNWDAAIDFVSRCQNLETNDQEYVALTDENRGGFVYFPGDSKAGEEEKGDKIALRSYGSMGYAGLLSFIYAEMDPNDKRVVAVKEWLGENYAIDENPGMGAQGLFYYYHTMAKALSLTSGEKIELADGTKVKWREQLAVKLFDEQQEDGSWINEGSSRWWEDDRVLVTSYAILALEHIARQL